MLCFIVRHQILHMNGFNADNMHWEEVELLVKSLVDKSADDHGFEPAFEENKESRKLDKFFYKHYEGLKENSFKNSSEVRQDYSLLSTKDKKALEGGPAVIIKSEPENPVFKDFQQHLKVLKSGKMALGTQIEKGRDLLVLLEQAVQITNSDGSKTRLAEFLKMMERSETFLGEIRTLIVSYDKITPTCDEVLKHDNAMAVKVTECLSHHDGLKQAHANYKAYL